MKVLIVDDMPFMRRVLGEIIASGGNQVVGEASSGTEAMERYRDIRPDVVLMDIVMPEMDGITALSRILDEDPMATVIVSSDLNQKALIKKALKIGAWDYVVKPFSRERVLEVFHSLEIFRGRTDALAALKKRKNLAGNGQYADTRIFLGL